MQMIILSYLDLAIGGSLVVVLALVTWILKISMASRLLIGGLRTFLQLSLIGFAIKFIFQQHSLLWISVISLIMLLAAGREVMARQKRPLKGLWAFGVGVSSMLVSSVVIAMFSLTFLLEATPWYEPRYAIPMLGILLGNTMNGISLAVDRLTESAYRQKTEIEGRLILGETAKQAIKPIKQEALRTGLTPITNIMAAAGLVSLPGLMTGQILAGGDPLEAAKYQILIIFLIVAGTGFGILFSLEISSRRLFDERHRLCLHRLKKAPKN